MEYGAIMSSFADLSVLDMQYAYLTGVRDYVLSKKDYLMQAVYVIAEKEISTPSIIIF